MSPDNARAVLSGLQASYPVAKIPSDIENRTIPDGPDGKDISITIVRPANSSNETLPVVMFIHGGGWVLGGFDTHERLVRELANKANVAVVFVNYTLSPEAKYPIALEQAYAATRWVAQNGQSININSSRLAVVGDSVGGNLTAALTLLAKERGGPPIRFYLTLRSNSINVEVIFSLVLVIFLHNLYNHTIKILIVVKNAPLPFCIVIGS
jgi:acetyl esterase